MWYTLVDGPISFEESDRRRFRALDAERAQALYYASWRLLNIDTRALSMYSLKLGITYQESSIRDGSGMEAEENRSLLSDQINGLAQRPPPCDLLSGPGMRQRGARCVGFLSLNFDGAFDSISKWAAPQNTTATLCLSFGPTEGRLQL